MSRPSTKFTRAYRLAGRKAINVNSLYKLRGSFSEMLLTYCYVQVYVSSEISCFYGGAYEDDSLLGYCTV
jgi:hypothetical protein